MTQPTQPVPALYQKQINQLLHESDTGQLRYQPQAGCYTDAVFIGDTLIALFAMRKDKFSPLRTVEICDVLRRYVFMPMPSARERGEGVIICPLFSGQPLYRDILLSQPEPVRDILADQLGEFLVEKQLAPVTEFGHLNLPNRIGDYSPSLVESTIKSFLEKAASYLMWPVMAWIREHCLAFSLEELSGWVPVVVHGELAPPHIFFDPQKGKITGIIDFGEAYIGDPAVELFWLIWSYGQRFVDQVVQGRPELEMHYRRARFLMGFIMMQWMLKGILGSDARWFGRFLTLPFDFVPLKQG